MQSSISVVIPAHNLEAYLRPCVLSALHQTVPPLEILIIDNNSSDHTLQIAYDLQQQYPDVIQVLQEPQQGAPYARNRGLEKARGEWIQFLDGDDLLLPHKLEYQLQYTTGQAGCIVSPAIDRSSDGQERMIQVMDEPWKGLFSGGGYLGYTSSILWNAAAVRAVNGWDVALHRNQEYDLMFRLMIEGFPPVVAPEAYTIKREREGQITQTSYAEFLLSFLYFRGKVLRYALQHEIPDRKTISYFFKILFTSYSRLRVRNSGYAREIKDKVLDSIITAEVRRRFPEISLYQVRSNAYVLLKQFKARLGRRGLYGKWMSNRSVSLLP